jgi:UDP-N-acetyl-D-galactosamine dehydrogenase
MTINSKIYPCVIGLGYVGLPIFKRLIKKFQVIGFDINKKRISELNKGIDNNEVKRKKFYLPSKNIITSSVTNIKKSNFFIICVPTPIFKNNKPDLSLLKKASKNVAKNIKKNDIIFYESTVYPGVTKKICLPIIEKHSKLKEGKDFFIGYSPERINPGDKINKISNIFKIVAFENKQIKNKVLKIYKSITKKIILSNNIEEAETSKVIENIQRDLNIGLMNEIYKVSKKINVNFENVIKLAKTKWNFIEFKPGLVGGHCLPVDPYYFSFLAKQKKIDTNVILAGRSVNNGMKNFIYTEIINFLKINKIIKKNKIIFLGATYKKNVPDLRNSLSLDIYKKFKKNGFNCFMYDPLITKEQNSINNFLHKLPNLKKYKAVIILVNHDAIQKIIEKSRKVILLHEIFK